MICRTVTLAPFEDATITAICTDNTKELKQSPRRAVIIFPGGGYSMTSDREAEPVAAQFLAAGFATFILRYSVGKRAKDLIPLKEAALGVAYVRQHAAEFNVDPNYVFVCGFSAGGHAAGALGVYWNHPAVREILGKDTPTELARPTGMILCYPVITGGIRTHGHSLQRWCGAEEPTDEQRDAFSLEKHVDAATPPTFLWHTFSDGTVPVQNSLMMAAALRDANVPFELHIYPAGHHGLSLANEQTCSGNADYIVPHVQSWMPLAIRWATDFEK